MSKDYKEYDDLGVRFIYPSNWFVQTETWDKGTYGITVDSPEGSFWSLAIYPKGVDLDAAAKQILGTLDAEYDEMDQAEVKRYVADRVLAGYEVNFFYLDLTSTALVLKFEDERRGYVVYWQTCDRLALTGENLSRADVFDAMTHTLVSNLTGQEVEYRDQDADEEFDFGAPVDEKARRVAENREFYRQKYERQRWEAEEIRRREALDDEEIRRNLNDENNDETFRRDWVAADERLEDFLRVDDEENDDAFEEIDDEEFDDAFKEVDEEEFDDAFEEVDEEEADARD